MTKIRIPFLPRWRAQMLAGLKTHTCRSEAYGQPGDQFRAFGATFELLAVWETTLQDVAENYFRQEGCGTPHEFVGVWNQIHPRRGFIPTDRRWLHHFRLLPHRTPGGAP